MRIVKWIKYIVRLPPIHSSAESEYEQRLWFYRFLLDFGNLMDTLIVSELIGKTKYNAVREREGGERERARLSLCIPRTTRIAHQPKSMLAESHVTADSFTKLPFLWVITRTFI